MRLALTVVLLLGTPQVASAAPGSSFAAWRLRLPFRAKASPPTGTTHRAAEREGLGARLADRVAGFAGSWKFIGWSTASMGAWMAYNALSGHPFDAPPYIGLNLLLSTVAALQAPFILMSQNRQSEKDRIRAERDLAVNIKAEREIRRLDGKLNLVLEHASEREARLRREIDELRAEKEVLLKSATSPQARPTMTLGL
jgi:uncharacterized membrane protein